MATVNRADGSTYEVFSVSIDTETCKLLDELCKNDNNRSRSKMIEMLTLAEVERKKPVSKKTKKAK